MQHPDEKVIVKKRGGVRLGAGRKAIIGVDCKRLNVSLDQETCDFLSALGSGNLSSGIRLASARLIGNVAWQSTALSEKAISDIQSVASWNATMALHKYLTMEHLLLAVPNLADEISWQIIPDCHARVIMFKELEQVVEAQMIKTETPGQLLPSKAYERVVERLHSGAGLLSAIAMEEEPSLASRCLKQYGFQIAIDNKAN